MDEKRIEAAAKELVNALDRCADVINGAFQFAAIHVADYTDAVKLIYGKELDALKRALAGEGEQASPSCGDWGQGVSDTNPKAPEGAIAMPEHEYIACHCEDCFGSREAACALCHKVKSDQQHNKVMQDEEKLAIAIPEDLRGEYKLACAALRRDPFSVGTEAEVIKTLIERIASLTQRAELAESRVKELSKPVTDEEWKEWTGGYGMGRGTFNALISERAASKAPDSAPVGGKEGER